MPLDCRAASIAVIASAAAVRAALTEPAKASTPRLKSAKSGGALALPRPAAEMPAGAAGCPILAAIAAGILSSARFSAAAAAAGIVSGIAVGGVCGAVQASKSRAARLKTIRVSPPRPNLGIRIVKFLPVLF